MMTRFIALLLALPGVINQAHADTDACFAHAAQRRHLNVNLLRAIARVESNYRPYVTNTKTYAIGEMQIMPFHLSWLKRYGIYEHDLYDACTNINVGAFVLADFIRMYGNTWRAVGAYGAGMAPNKEQARIGYVQLVQQAYDRITNPSLAGSLTFRGPRRADQVKPERPTMVVQQ